MSQDRKESYWFKHDSNSQDDPKCMLLIDQLGMEGYGIFWALLEKLRAEKTHTLSFSVLPSFARRWATSTEKVTAVVKNYNLFVTEGDFFYSIRLKSDMDEKTSNARKSVSYRWNNTNVLHPNSDLGTPDIRNDTIREEKKRKEKRGVGSGKALSYDKAKAVRITNGKAYFPDGSYQKLGEMQIFLLSRKELDPSHITKGIIE